VDVKVPETILEQNYPNPFVGETTLEFTAHGEPHVRQDMFAALGRHVETVVDQRYSSGARRVRWNSESLSRGVYLLRIEDYGRQAGVRKIVRR
jgi:hypothetical protein